MGFPRENCFYRTPKLVQLAHVAKTSAASAIVTLFFWSTSPVRADVVVLHEFSGTNGRMPSLALGRVGDTLFGTTQGGGTVNSGTVYALKTDGTNFQTLHHFDGSDGTSPLGVLLAGETLFGVAFGGGSLDRGTIYRIDTDGTNFDVLHEFSGPEGALPFGLTLDGTSLFAVTNGHLAHNFGTLMSVESDGSNFETLFTFNSFPNGILPSTAVVLSGNIFFGQTTRGGATDSGTIYSIGTDGSNYQLLHSFSADQKGTMSPRLLLSDGLVLGTTSGILGSTFGTIFSMQEDGTDFQVLHEFDGIDGRNPFAGMTLVGDRLFGLAYGGGAADLGTIYTIRVDGSDFRVLHEFDGADGAEPAGELLREGNTLYGTTLRGGAFDDGVVFAIAIPEPSTFMLGAIGIAVVAVSFARRRIRGLLYVERPDTADRSRAAQAFSQGVESIGEPTHMLARS